MMGRRFDTPPLLKANVFEAKIEIILSEEREKYLENNTEQTLTGQNKSMKLLLTFSIKVPCLSVQRCVFFSMLFVYLTYYWKGLVKYSFSLHFESKTYKCEFIRRVREYTNYKKLKK